MNEHVNSKLSKYLRRVAIAIVASGTVAAPAAYAGPSNNLIVVPPTDLPELARQTGEAMLLHEAINGRTLLYIEQNHRPHLRNVRRDTSFPAPLSGD